MMILAFEFSSSQRSVAVIDQSPSAKWQAGSEVIETGGFGTKALAMVDTALQEAKVEREQIEILAIGLGPGSYHGLRLSIAMAQGWQLASGGHGTKLLGISSAECIAAAASEEGIEGRVTVVIDAQRREFYVATYELASNHWRQLESLGVETLEQVQGREAAGGRLIGPEISKWFPSSRKVFPRAAILGRLALGRSDFASGEKLEPIYLRETQFVKAPSTRTI